jgi:hypothetical protein
MKGDAAVGAHGLRDLGELFEHLIDAIALNHALVEEFKRKINIRLKGKFVKKFGNAFGISGDPKTKVIAIIAVPVLENETH